MVARQVEEQSDIIAWFAGSQQIEVPTRAVTQDEPCYWLREMNLLSRTGKKMNRYQLLSVVRGDRLVTARILLGPSSRFRADQFQVIGGEIFEGRGRVWHTVAELQEQADEIRNRPPFREIEPSDWQTIFRDHVEERGRRRRHQSTFGAGVHLQRD